MLIGLGAVKFDGKSIKNALKMHFLTKIKLYFRLKWSKIDHFRPPKRGFGGGQGGGGGGYPPPRRISIEIRPET